MITCRPAVYRAARISWSTERATLYDAVHSTDKPSAHEAYHEAFNEPERVV